MKLSEKQVVETIGAVSVTELRVWVSEGWIRPRAGAAGREFDEIDIARIRLVCELRETLGLEEETVPLVLSLIDQLHGLRGELRTLTGVIDEQPDDIRSRLLAAYEAKLKTRG